MQVDDFFYDLPDELIASHPAERRDGSRLLVVPLDPAQPFEHRTFSDLPEYLRAGDLLVMNDTRVIPARLYGHRASGGKIEMVLLHEEEEDSSPQAPRWRALLKPAKKVALNETIQLGGENSARVVAIHETGERTLQFETKDFRDLLTTQGQMPIPPYILKRRVAEGAEHLHENADRERYQTVYARPEGSVAAPTAGLHFTRELLDRIHGLGVATAFVTLHVGAGTFQTMEPHTRVEDHAMHDERYEISETTANLVERTRAAGGRIIAVGTTTVRTLESAWDDAAQSLRRGAGNTRLMIVPGTKLRVVNGLVTNFHLPRSTLLLLVSALASRQRILQAYAEAIRLRYRFYSYGDAMLII